MTEIVFSVLINKVKEREAPARIGNLGELTTAVRNGVTVLIN